MVHLIVLYVELLLKEMENASIKQVSLMIFKQITVFHIGSDEHQDIDVAILTALLKGEFGTRIY